MLHRAPVFGEATTPLACPTMTFPTMAGWILHLYRKVPALLNTRLKDSPGESKPESHSPEFDVEV